MKKIIRMKDSNGNVLKEEEVVVRDIAHFQAQLMYRSHKVESKKVYNRKRLGKVEW